MPSIRFNYSLSPKNISIHFSSLSIPFHMYDSVRLCAQAANKVPGVGIGTKPITMGMDLCRSTKPELLRRIMESGNFRVTIGASTASAELILDRARILRFTDPLTLNELAEMGLADVPYSQEP